MCGIHGFVTGKKRNNNADDFVFNAFVAGSLRGTDSSGIASVNVGKGTIDYQKLPISGPMFIGERYAEQLIKVAPNIDTITICHTRSATSGKIGINEAHPFFVDNADGRELVGVHNGTLTGWWNKKGAKDFTVDSEWALNHIFDEGIDAFEDFSGAYCFAWWDNMDENHLNFALNNDRPMCVAMTDDDGMAYASEPGMLYWLCERNKIKLTGPIMQLAGKHMYKFNIHKLGEFTKLALPEPKVIIAPASTYPGYQAGSNVYKSNKSVMVRVKELMETIGDKPSSQAAAPAVVPVAPRALSLVPKMPMLGSAVMVTAAEAQTARELQIMNEKGSFTPYWIDDSTGEVTGIFAQSTGGEMSAVIRCGSTLNFGPDTTWVTTCIGAQDSGDEIILVCDRPHLTVREKHAAAFTAPATAAVH